MILPAVILPAVIHLSGGNGYRCWTERSPGDPSYSRWLADAAEGGCAGIAGEVVAYRGGVKGNLHNVAHAPCRLRPVVDDEGVAWGECPVTGIWIRLEPDLQAWTKRCVARSMRG